MSMLAENKRREKWSLNPRGNAWSKDQNKFGQRLMEKMGWKTGEGLGINGQGPTDIVKTTAKNDSKGLGFKEDTEKWLKTTIDFDNMLDELASSIEDNGNESQTQLSASLEDRSKKSRARVHYHKFTRSKDLSRYSEKDLASIIGPEVFKVKSGQESKSDYTINQINKGSIEEYFNKKSKSQDSNTVDNTTGDIISERKTVTNYKSEIVNSNHKIEISEEHPEPDSEVMISLKKKKKKRKRCDSDENYAQGNVSVEDKGNCQLKTDQNSVTDVSIKKKRKSKSDCVFNNSMCELNENYLNVSNLVTSEPSEELTKEHSADLVEQKDLLDSSVSESHNKMSKKRNRKYEHSVDIENLLCLENTVNETEDNVKRKKKRQKFEGRDIVQIENVEFTNKNPVIDTEDVASNEAGTKKKKKKSKIKNKEHIEDPSEVLQQSMKEPDVNDENVFKKKNKKSKDQNQAHEKDLLEEEQTTSTKKNKKGKKDKQLIEESTSETGPKSEQVNSDSVEIAANNFERKKKKHKKSHFNS